MAINVLPLAGKIIGLGLKLYAGENTERVKFKWLGHYLSGSGTALRIPDEIASQWNHAMVKWHKDNEYYIRPYPAMLFWLVGTMKVIRENGRVYGTDKYDFHKQNGQRVVFGTDKTPQYAFSGGKDDPTKIPTRLYPMIRLFAKVFNLKDLFRMEDNLLTVSNNLWNVLGGKSFESILEVKESE